MQMEESQREAIPMEEWENDLKAVHIGKEDMNKLVMNFLVTECYVDAAEKFTKESGTKHTDLETVQDRADIRRNILGGDIDAAYAFLSIYFEQFRRPHPVYFWLGLQRIIERIRDGKVEEAVKFGQQFFLHLAAPHPFEEVEKTFCLLVFEDPFNCPFAELLGDSLRLETANAVNQAILSGEGQEKEPKLYNMLRELLLVQYHINQIDAYPTFNISTGILEDSVIREIKGLPLEG